ncbi:MAG: glycosyltransferase family 4 protein [Syntrophales bacterium LBB04]|nr:glycosyltransferase family 4 protein [Syntrophales bacterium LBB04]
MRILMFGWEFPPHISGGLGTACFGITRALAKPGTEVIFVLPRIAGDKKRVAHVKLLSASDIPFPGPGMIDEELWNNLKMKVVDSTLRPYMNEGQYQGFLAKLYEGGTRRNYEMSGDYGPNLMAEIWRYGMAAEAIVKSESFDIIHGHDWTSVIACVRAKRMSGRPYIYHAHALEFDRSGEDINAVVYEMEKYGMETADHVIAVSYYTKNNIIKRYGIAPEKITVIHNAVSRSDSEVRVRAKEREGEKIVLFLGRITFQKGPDYFIEAAALTLKAIPDVRFVMAGAGDMLPKMIGRVSELQMGAHFSFTGFLRGEDVERIYAVSDLYVMPSVSEPFGISPLEAMLYDVPVIISKQSGVSEILHHALKVDFWDVMKLADKMIALLRYPSLANEMTGRAREELKNIRWERAAEKILSLYRQVLQSS